MDIEQSMPNILLCSLPQLPDRTRSFTQGKQKELIFLIKEQLSKIRVIHAKKIIFCCFTIHGFLSQLLPDEQNNIISLPDLLLQEIMKRQERTLILCTYGTRSLSIFENSPYWNGAKKFMVFCNDDDQKHVHKLIYELKMGKLDQCHFQYINQLVKKYSVSCWAVACTEFHLLTTAFYFGAIQEPLAPFVDPLLEFSLALNLRTCRPCDI